MAMRWPTFSSFSPLRSQIRSRFFQRRLQVFVFINHGAHFVPKFLTL